MEVRNSVKTVKKKKNPPLHYIQKGNGMLKYAQKYHRKYAVKHIQQQVKIHGTE